MSWFKNITDSIPQNLDITSLTDSLQEAQNSIENKIQNAIGAENTLLGALTLQTDELEAERHQIDLEEQRKEDVKNVLASIYPWETRDEEKQLLEGECRVAMLALSTSRQTFIGPHGNTREKIITDDTEEEISFVDVNLNSGVHNSPNSEGDMQSSSEDKELIEKEVPENISSKKEEDQKVTDSKNNTLTQKEDPYAVLKSAILARIRADNNMDDLHGPLGTGGGNDDNVSTEKKCGGLFNAEIPILLAEFDLDAHVGLIQRLFQCDPNLVEMHKNLSGGEVKEIDFWKNYFHHCALTRLEMGLGINEIWGDQNHAPSAEKKPSSPLTSSVWNLVPKAVFSDEKEIISENDEKDESSAPSKGSNLLAEAISQPASATRAVMHVGDVPLPPLAKSVTPIASILPTPASLSSSAKDESFELVQSAGASPTLTSEDLDQMDDLDAEIARELEGI
eukprot:CAMPEP_0194355614 /NCGR_PEP_ID=MMETSP0174-20130528/3500_1 /TAXON_ID=216777 /ORGANISM="Proboscia alata, Strain PI-D3" /LENGTH=450 /DNA_ID=CAMNT_0039124957 /DNA_START=101 /DNA_END=1453 /DNA_ORIENTATION=+